MNTEQKIFFGLGCFHFGYYPKSTIDPSGADYVKDLRNTLKKITNIEDININVEEHFNSIKIKAEENFCAIDQGFDFFPFPQCDLHVQFTLFIPDRVQKELTAESLYHSSGCERFLVDIEYTYFFPITVVRAINPSENFDASEGVFLTRKFLEDCLACGKDSTIQFESLGPSPFHSNFTLSPAHAISGEKFRYERHPSHAYDSHIFKYNTSYFDSIDEAFEELLFNLEGQVGLFYQITHSSMLHNQNWVEYYNQVQTIIKQHKTKGFKAFWLKTFRAQENIHDAMIDLAQIESFDLDIKYKGGSRLASPPGF